MSSPALVIILATDAFRSLISEFLYPHFLNIDIAIPRTSYLAHWPVEYLSSPSAWQQGEVWHKARNLCERKTRNQFGREERWREWSIVEIYRESYRADRNFSRLIKDRCENKIRLVSFYEHVGILWSRTTLTLRTGEEAPCPLSSFTYRPRRTLFIALPLFRIGTLGFKVDIFRKVRAFFPGTSPLPKKLARIEWPKFRRTEGLHHFVDGRV